MGVPLTTLRQVPLLAELEEAELSRVGAAAELMLLRRRQVAWRETEEGEQVGWVVRGGLVGISYTVDGRETTLFRCGTGEVFGEAEALLGMEAKGMGVIWMAAEESVVVVAPSRVWRGVLEQNPKAALAAGVRLARQQRRFLRLRQVLADPNAARRVGAILLWLAREGREGEEGWRWLPGGVTQQEVAGFANTTRETVTRVMQRLQAAGVVARGEEGWRVDEEALEAFLREAGES
ncbi:MAG: Crp/Fnr family transcriptional regulator [Hydrogenophilus sp.]|nr:Crp/Fnr family transcriptional regulator [Hydrogenophilus sp.]